MFKEEGRKEGRKGEREEGRQAGRQAGRPFMLYHSKYHMHKAPTMTNTLGKVICDTDIK